MTAVCIMVSPAEAADLVDHWPADAWLVVRTGGGEAAEWDVVAEAGLSDAAAGCAVWPPTGALAVADISAREELWLLRRVLAEDGLGERAAERMATTRPSDGEILAEDIEW